MDLFNANLRFIEWKYSRDFSKTKNGAIHTSVRRAGKTVDCSTQIHTKFQAPVPNNAQEAMIAIFTKKLYELSLSQLKERSHELVDKLTDNPEDLLAATEFQALCRLLETLQQASEVAAELQQQEKQNREQAHRELEARVLQTTAEPFNEHKIRTIQAHYQRDYGFTPTAADIEKWRVGASDWAQRNSQAHTEECVMCDLCCARGDAAGLGGRVLDEPDGITFLCESCWSDWTCVRAEDRKVNTVERAMALKSGRGCNPKSLKASLAPKCLFTHNVIAYLQTNKRPYIQHDMVKHNDNQWHIDSIAFTPSKKVKEATSSGRATYICDSCGHTSANKPKRCGGCRYWYFCSKQCQKVAWPLHKAFCRKFSFPFTPSEVV